MTYTRETSASSTALGSGERTAPTAITVTVVGIAAIVVVGQLYATIGMLPQLAAAFETSQGAAAWASTAFGVAYAGGMLVAGPMSDVLGRRRVATVGLLAGAAAALLVSAAPNFGLLVATRTLQGAAAALFPTVVLAYLTERVQSSRLSIAVTIVVSSYVAAAVLAPMASRALVTVGGWRTWFYTSAVVLVLLAGVLRRIMLPDYRSRDTSLPSGGRSLLTAVASLRNVPALLSLPRLVGLYMASLVVMLTFVAVTTLVQLTGPGTAGDAATMRAVRAATLPACVLAPLAALLLTRVPGRRRLVAMMGLLAASILATGFAGGPVALAVTLGVLTAAVALTGPALVETIAKTGPPQQRGTATALYGFSLFVGASLATPAATALSGISFVPAVLVFVAVAVLGGLAALFGARPARDNQPPAANSGSGWHGDV